jgi:hypothetical protein
MSGSNFDPIIIGFGFRKKRIFETIPNPKFKIKKS